MRRKTPRNGEENQRHNNRSQSPTKDAKIPNARRGCRRQVRRWLSQRTKILIVTLNITIVLCLHRAIRSQLGHVSGTHTKSSAGVSNPFNFFSGLLLTSMSKDSSSLHLGYRNVTQLPAPPQPFYPWDRTIPHTLWFTFKENILETQKPKHFHDNVKKTIKLYTEALDAVVADNNDDDDNLHSSKTRINFLDDDHCLSQISLAISRIEKEYPVVANLEKNFVAESNGAYKSDICRLAALYLHGGYYFDVDMEVIKPLVVETLRKRRPPWRKPRLILDTKYFYQDEVKEFINDINEEAKIKYHNYHRIIDDRNTTLNVTFLTVLTEGKDAFFQSFLASTPGHPIVKVALAIIADYYKKFQDTTLDDRDHDYLIGPNTLYEAYRNVTGVNSETIANPRDRSNDYIFAEEIVGLPLESTHTRDREDIYAEFKSNLKRNRDDLVSLLQPNIDQEYVYGTSYILQELPLHDGVLPDVPRRPSKNINCNYVVRDDGDATKRRRQRQNVPHLLRTTNDNDDDVVDDSRVYFYSRIVGSTNCPVEELPSWWSGWWDRFFGREEEEGTCGQGHVGNEKCPDKDDCCSYFGWCGRGPAFC